MSFKKQALLSFVFTVVALVVAVSFTRHWGLVLAWLGAYLIVTGLYLRSSRVWPWYTLVVATGGVLSVVALPLFPLWRLWLLSLFFVIAFEWALHEGFRVSYLPLRRAAFLGAALMASVVACWLAQLEGPTTKSVQSATCVLRGRHFFPEIKMCYDIKAFS